MSELEDRLKEIHGVGDAKADEILGILDAGSVFGEVRKDTSIDTVRELLEDAQSYHDEGDHAYAAKYVNQALRRLE